MQIQSHTIQVTLVPGFAGLAQQHSSPLGNPLRVRKNLLNPTGQAG